MKNMKKKKKQYLKDVFVVIPFYNEGKILTKVVRELKIFFQNIICIDDGSERDHEIYSKKLNIYLLRHPINLGQGAAIQTGINFALKKKAKIIISYDADGQHSSKDAISMVWHLIKNNLDLVQGSRFLKATRVKIPIIRKIILKFAILISNYFDNTKLTDTHNGLRVFNAKFAKKINIVNNRMAHPHDINNLISKWKFKYNEFSTKIKYTKYSMQKGQKNLNSINILFDILVSKLIAKI